jgi:ATP-dependent Zn protease
MDDQFGLAVVSSSNAVGGTMSAEVRTAVNRILNEQMAEALRLILENKAKIDALVEVLMVKNHLNGVQINEILSK